MGLTFRLPISSLLTLAKGSVYFHILSGPEQSEEGGRERGRGREGGSLTSWSY